MKIGNFLYDPVFFVMPSISMYFLKRDKFIKHQNENYSHAAENSPTHLSPLSSFSASKIRVSEFFTARVIRYKVLTNEWNKF